MIIGEQLTGPLDAELRFSAGCELALIKLRAVALRQLDVATIEEILAAVVKLVEPKAQVAIAEQRFAPRLQQLKKALPRRTKKELALPVDRYLHEGDSVERWVGAVFDAAHRVGAMLCGDIVAALRGMASSRRADVSESIAAQRLLTFAVDRRFTNLRREFGA